MRKDKFGMVLPITLLSYFLILMDNSIIFTSSVEIGVSLELSNNSLAWISNAYTLAFGGFLLLSGRLSDLLGRKRIFQIGLLIFGFSSLVIGVSQSSWLTIVGRGVQGLGSSIIAPMTLALMMDAYQGEKRVRAISYYGAMAGIGSSIGILLGGALTSFISWRVGFLINVPLVILLITLTQRYVKKDEGQSLKIDYIGSMLSVVGLVSLIYGLDAEYYKTIFIGGGILVLIFFYNYEKKQRNPILPLELFNNKVRLGAYIGRALFMMSMLPYWFLLPQVLQRDYGYNALQSGFAFLPVSIMTFLTALQLPKLTKRFGNNRVLFMGEVILLLGLTWSAVSSLEKGYLLAVALPMIIIGIGQALIVAPITSAGIYKATSQLAGSASGVTNAMHQLGGPIGLSIIISLTSNFQISLRFMALFTMLGLIVVYFLVYKSARAR